MDTALYYTLSTIAQTLAGALAILVAFALFRLSALDGTIRLAQYELQGAYGEIWPKLWDALCADGLEGLEKELKAPVHGHRVRAAYHEGGIAWRARPRITRRLYAALGCSVVDMALCFTALPFIPRIICSTWAIGIVLGSAVGLGIICLGLYVWLIAAMVRRPE